MMIRQVLLIFEVIILYFIPILSRVTHNENHPEVGD